MKRAIRVLLLFAMIGGLTGFSVQAQAIPPGTPGGFIVALCSATNYDAIVSKALSIAPADLRTALVSGQTLDMIASSKADALNKALLDAHLGEIGQALSDGLLTQDQAKQFVNQVTNRFVPGNTQFRVPIPDVSAYSFQAVKAIQIAAGALTVKCPDLVRAIANGHSLVSLVSEGNGQIGSVLDAIIKSYLDALSQDIQDQLITQVQAKGLQVQLSEWTTALLNQSGPGVLMQFSNPPGLLPGYYYSVQNTSPSSETQPGRPTPMPSNTKTPTPVATPSL